jgi:hypothetical protein
MDASGIIVLWTTDLMAFANSYEVAILMSSGIISLRFQLTGEWRAIYKGDGISLELLKMRYIDAGGHVEDHPTMA